MAGLNFEIDSLKQEISRTDSTLNTLYCNLGRIACTYHRAIDCPESNVVFEEICSLVQLKEELEVEEPSLIISRRPCALLKEVKHNPPLKVDEAKCKSCKMCMKIGCPAIAMKNGKAKIDNTLCVGCGVCSQMCKFGAL